MCWVNWSILPKNEAVWGFVSWLAQFRDKEAAPDLIGLPLVLIVYRSTYWFSLWSAAPPRKTRHSPAICGGARVLYTQPYPHTCNVKLCSRNTPSYFDKAEGWTNSSKIGILLLLAKVKGNWSLVTLAKSNCDSWFLFLRSCSISKLCCSKMVHCCYIISHCMCGDMTGCGLHSFFAMKPAVLSKKASETFRELSL